MPSVSRRAAHLACGAFDNRFGGQNIRLRGRAMRDVPERFQRRLRCPPRPGMRGLFSSRSSVSARSKPASAFGPVCIDTQKQVPPASSAIDGDDEGVPPPHFVGRIRIRPVAEDPVLDGNCIDFATAYADKGKFGWLYLLVGNGDAVVTVMRRPQPLDGRVQIAASTSAGQRQNQTAHCRRDAASYSGRLPADRSSPPGDRADAAISS